jgi:hypothetical protein
MGEGVMAQGKGLRVRGSDEVFPSREGSGVGLLWCWYGIWSSEVIKPRA